MSGDERFRIATLGLIALPAVVVIPVGLAARENIDWVASAAAWSLFVSGFGLLVISVWARWNGVRSGLRLRVSVASAFAFLGGLIVPVAL